MQHWPVFLVLSIACLACSLITSCDDANTSNSNEANEPVPPALQPLIGGDAADQPMTGPVSIMSNYVEAGNTFGVNVFWAASQGDAGKANMFISPYSLTSAMDLAMQGARSTTLEQFWRIQQYKLLADQPDVIEVAKAYKKLSGELTPPEQAPYQFTSANAVWGLNGFTPTPSIQDVSSKYFKGGFKELNQPPNQARAYINSWISSNTNNLINDLLPQGSITTDSRLVLTNAVYFKGTWSSVFSKSATRERTFTLTDGSEIQTPMMSNGDDRFKLLEAAGYQAIELPYKGNAMSMVIFLPEKAGGLSNLQASLLGNSKIFDALDKLDEQGHQPVSLMLPKFKLTWGTENLTPVLESLGMTLPFSPSADFSGFTTAKEKLTISGIYHKAFIDVDEVGTEAAAATAIGIRATSVMIDQPPSFHANRPFLFLIRHDETGVILFLGRLTDPR